MTQLARGLVRSDVPASPPRSSRQACHSSPAAPRTFSAATRWQVGTDRFLSFLFPSTIVKKKKAGSCLPIFFLHTLRELWEGMTERGRGKRVRPS